MKQFREPKIGLGTVLILLLTVLPLGLASITQAQESFFELSAVDAGGKRVSLREYSGKVVLAVNIHLKCGTTPQLVAVQNLYERYRHQGLEVLAFPSEDFGKMDQTNDEEIKKICNNDSHVTFPVFGLTKVSGKNISDTYRFLTQSGTEPLQGEVSFNFEKFIIGRNGRVTARFGSFTGATSLLVTEAVEFEINKAIGE